MRRSPDVVRLDMERIAILYPKWRDIRLYTCIKSEIGQWSTPCHLFAMQEGDYFITVDPHTASLSITGIMMYATTGDAINDATCLIVEESLHVVRRIQATPPYVFTYTFDLISFDEDSQNHIFMLSKIVLRK